MNACAGASPTNECMEKEYVFPIIDKPIFRILNKSVKKSHRNSEAILGFLPQTVQQ